MSQCKIYLENYTGTYYPGSQIRGRLECYFDDETTIRGIKIRLKCIEHNEWTGTESYTDPDDHKTKTRHITLSGDNNILSFEQMLFGSGSTTQSVNRGRQVYPFVYTLPHDIPSTFNGPHGTITYKLKGIVDRPMRVDYEDKFIFVVISPIDFNKLPTTLQEVATYSEEKTVCCWCCQGGNLTMEVELPKTAFIPGEVINCKVNVVNLSNSNVRSLDVKFKKTVTYKVTTPHSESKEDIEDILSKREHGVGAHGEHTYNLQLTIPEYIVVPNFTNCKLFDVSYLLKLSCEMPSCTMDLDVSIWNIKMGHIQYNGGMITQQPHAGFTPGFVNSLPPIDGAYPPALPPNPYSPPYPSSAPGFVPPAYPAKPVYPGGEPTAPVGATAPYDNNPKAREAVRGPSAPYASIPEMPPPSYSQVQQNSGNMYSPYPN